MSGSTYRRALVVGAAGGIGGALIARLRARGLVDTVIAWSRRRPAGLDAAIDWAAVDVTDEASIAAAAARLPEVDLVIVATGVLQADVDGGLSIRPEKSWRALDPQVLSALFAINTIGPVLVAKHVLSRWPRDRRTVFAALSARVGSISDNRLGGWYGYRASKAALNQMLRGLAIELAVRHPQAIVLGLHPGTVDTPLSKPFQAGVLGRSLLTPEAAADHLLDVIAARSPADSGRVFDWAGVEVPP